MGSLRLIGLVIGLHLLDLSYGNSLMLFSIFSHQPILPNSTVIGAVTYSRDMYPHWLQIHAPLTDQF